MDFDEYQTFYRPARQDNYFLYMAKEKENVVVCNQANVSN